MAADYDPDTTPTRRRTENKAWPTQSMVLSYDLTRRKSWEEDSVTSLADPRDWRSVAIGEIWRGDFVQGSKDAFADFYTNLKMEFLPSRAQDYHRMNRALKKKKEDG